MKLRFGERAELEGPLLIPSISSFETQYSGKEALKFQEFLGEPISLVSAFDVANDNGFQDYISEYRDSGGIVFIDSGGYEYARSKKYYPKDPEIKRNFEKAGWGVDNFHDVVKGVDVDLVASYDVYVQEKEELESYIDRLLSSFFADLEHINGEIVPVLHLQSEDGGRQLGIESFVEVVGEVIKGVEPTFIAIPERELGFGLLAKMENCRRIVDKLRENGGDTQLHILGCGNPLSFAFFAAAGVAMADGLEWCRTNYGPNFHLHHFQQFDILLPQDHRLSHHAEWMLDAVQEGSPTSVLIRNLAAQQTFGDAIRSSLEAGDLERFLRENFELESSAVDVLSGSN